jgi:hypothetical protein
MSRPTLVFNGPREINGTTYSHGAELPPGILTPEQIDQLLDQKLLAEIPQRRSLHRLFSVFSGCKEREPLDAEIADFALPE